MGIILKSISTIAANYLGKDKPLIWDHKITTRCNCQCVFCNIWKMNHNEELSTEGVKKLADQVYDLGCTIASFSGGEPLLRPDIKEILQHCKKRMRTNLITNGLLLKSKIKEIVPYCDNITISLDAPDETHDKLRGTKGVFKIATEGIKIASKYVPVSVNCVITEENLDKVCDMPEFIKQLGARSISFEPVVSLGDFSETAYDIKKNKKYLQVIDRLIKMKKAGAPIGNSMEYFKLVSGKRTWKCIGHRVYIRTNPKGGLVLPCGSWGGDYGFTDIDSKKDGAKAAWNSKKAVGLRRIADNCPYLDKCTFPCVVEPSLIYYGSVSSLVAYAKQARQIISKK